MVSEELKSKLQQITQQEIYKVIVSKPSDKAAKYRKIEIEKKSSGYQAAAYTQKQVFMKDRTGWTFRLSVRACRQ